MAARTLNVGHVDKRKIAEGRVQALARGFRQVNFDQAQAQLGACGVSGGVAVAFR